YTLLGTSINLAVTLPAAYALGRKDFVGRNFFTVMFVLTMFFEGGLIPTYLVVKNLGLIDTIWAMVLPNAAAIWNIILARVFLQKLCYRCQHQLLLLWRYFMVLTIGIVILMP